MAADLERLATLLPGATLDVAASWRPAPCDRLTVLRELLLPLVVEPDWPGPADPLPVGDGWVQPDLIDDDLDTFDQLRRHLSDREPGFGAERLAAVAQEWRLPVLPYRPFGPSNRTGDPDPIGPVDGAEDRAPTDLTGVQVLDLSSLWAGPLCTRLLADMGADVIKIDPDCRPDGFRERPSLYDELNGAKTIVDLDLRRPTDRDDFEALISGSDLLVESFSRRVLPNLGYDDDHLRELNSSLTRVSVVGFGRHEPEADWLAYGSGIHAVTGMGLVSGRARPAAVAYPDPLTGYRAATIASRALSGGGSYRHLEVALADAGRAVAGRMTHPAGVVR